MKVLNGAELALFIKERQAKQVRGLRQAYGVFPKLVIIVVGENPVIDTFVRLKEAYGADILIDVEVLRISQESISETLSRANEDTSVHGIVLQLPLPDPSQTDALVAQIAPEKDVDSLGGSDVHVSATAMAIDWLLNGYNVQLKDRSIAIVGRGRLVGAPLERLWKTAGLSVDLYDDTVQDLGTELRKADIIVTATGVPGLITSDMIAPGKVVVDAGTASEGGVIVGDLAPDVRERTDLTITPTKGGVGPLTIAALFDNVIAAARATVPKELL